MNTPLPSHPDLLALRQGLDQTLANGQALSSVVPRFRAQKALLDRLPAPFAPALEGILERIEAGALFTEESCSFSQSDLVAALHVWLQKADSRLS